MKITKYEHACVVLEDRGKRLVIDPGKFTEKLADLSNITAVVVSHVHSDHFSLENLRKIAKASPNAEFFGPSQVAAEAGTVNMRAVKAGETHEVDGFSLEFHGGDHELYEGFENIGVLVDNVFFHPGDSYTLPGRPVQVLGLPASAPWLRVPDTVDYLKSCRPKTAIPIHNALLSEIGESIHYRIISEAAKEIGADWQVLEPGESMEA